MKSGVISIGYGIAVFLAAVLPAAGQVGTATLNGVVTDASSAAVPNAEVTLESTVQQFTRRMVTNETGQYVFPAIPPGSYKLTVKKEGFKDENVSEFSLSSGQASTLNISLQVAAATGQVTVTEAPPLLQTSTATVGSVVQREQITQLPLLGRSFTSLLLLGPGVGTNATPRGGPMSANGAGVNPVFYGQRWRNNNFTLDGVSNNEPLFNSIPMQPPPEALAEMKMESGMSSGAYGHASGANVNVVTKSGTKEFHGDAWEFLRNNKLDSRTFFVPRLGPFRWNQFGGAIGGPLVIPKLIKKEHNWYFFAYYEGMRIRRAANTQLLVPTQDQLNGNFAGNAPIFDPYTTRVDAAGVRTRQPFANNQIPANLINASGKTIATELYPRPNLAPGVIPGANYFTPGSALQDGDQWSGRVDHQFGNKDNFFARYSDARNPRRTVGNPALPSSSYYRLTNIAVSETHLFSPTFLVTARFGLQRIWWIDLVGGDFTLAQRAGTLEGYPEWAGYTAIPPISITGYPSLNQGIGYYGPQYDTSWIADANKTAGKHTFEFGGNITNTRFKTNNQTGIIAQFSTTQTSNFVPGCGFALASYMLGLPESAGRVAGNTEGDMHGNTYSIYFQDNWRVTPRLTLNLGIRYDYASPLINNWGSGTFVYETGQYLWSKKNPITGEAANMSEGAVDPDRNNFQPRVGIAYSINPKTVIRTSYGIFFDTFGINYAQTQQGNRGNWPFAFPQTVSGLNATTPNAFFPNPFPGPAAGSTTPLGCQQCLNVWHATSRTPYVQQWTFSIQRQITSSLKAEGVYFGSHGVKISSQLIDNAALVPGSTPIASRQLRPQFPTFVTNGYNSYHSYYEGLTLSLDKRFSRGLSFMVNYTWSKSINYIDEMSDNIQLFGALPVRANFPKWRSVAGWDTPYRVALNWIYELPIKTGSRVANAIVAHWAITGIWTLDHGIPHSVYVNADAANIGIYPGRVSQFADLVGDPTAGVTHTPQRWFNTAAFRAPQSYTFGNTARNILRTDYLNSWNMSAYKRWPFRERKYIEFRTEFFNPFNHTIFGYPNFQVDSPAFGTVSSTRASGRSIQFGLKMGF